MPPPLPPLFGLHQQYPPSRVMDVDAVVRQQVKDVLGTSVQPGMRIAVGVGSRGIANLQQIVLALLAALQDAGAKPFIVPAMGSHGGGTPEGQLKVLEEFGVTPETTGVPFEASMEVRQIGEFLDGYPVVCSAAASDADGMIPINRVKPHTDFSGDLGSGLQKMLAIGFGKHEGARNTHSAASRLGHEVAIRETARVMLGAAPVLGGIAILEDQHHQTFDIRAVPREDIPAEEDKLFQESKALLPRLPFSRIDLLIIDELGKEISGTGMDTNVIGRDVLGYIASLRPQTSDAPHISRIFVRELTAASSGNGIGIGMADFTTTRAVRSLNLDYTFTNAITSLGLGSAKIPVYFDTDREVLEKAVMTLALRDEDELRVVRIKNTLQLDRMLVSEAMAREAKTMAGLTVGEAGQDVQFDEQGNLTAW